MKFYRYPLSIIAYALIFIFLIVLAWHWLGNKPLAEYWYYFLIGAGIYLTVAFVISKITMAWEIEVLIQVVFVLAPVLWYVNQREPYKRPVYIFLINSQHSGKLDIYFSNEKSTETKVRSTADTLYFKFDKNGEILLNEDREYVRESMRKNLFIFYADGERKRTDFYKQDALPADTTKKVLVEDRMEAENGKMKVMHFRLDYPQRLR